MYCSFICFYFYFPYYFCSFKSIHCYLGFIVFGVALAKWWIKKRERFCIFFFSKGFDFIVFALEIFFLWNKFLIFILLRRLVSNWLNPFRTEANHLAVLQIPSWNMSKMSRRKVVDIQYWQFWLDEDIRNFVHFYP